MHAANRFPRFLSRTLTGAWIETIECNSLSHFFARRTLTGAWIETIVTGSPLDAKKVAPLRVRGLKHGRRPSVK